MNDESTRCTRLSRLPVAFAFKLFFMSPIYFFISCNSSSRRAVLSFGPLDDRAEWSSLLDDWAVLAGPSRLGWVALPALSSWCLPEGGVFCASSSSWSRWFIWRQSASWSSLLFSLCGGGWLSLKGCGGVGGSFLITCHNSWFCHVVSRARSWMLVTMTCICLSMGVIGGSVLVPSLLTPSIVSTDLFETLFVLGMTTICIVSFP